MSEDIQVETHDGHKAAEKPRSVVLMGKKYDVEKVLESKRVSRVEDGAMEEHFKVKLKGYGEAEIVYNYEFGEWKKK
ncbi:MAG: hypothetical protein ABIH66_10255 [bacterium]